MVLCNITFSLDNDIEQQWLENYKKSMNPDALPGLSDVKLYKLITVHFGTGSTYALQLFFANRSLAEGFEMNHKDKLTALLCAPFGEKALSFYTSMEAVSL